MSSRLASEAGEAAAGARRQLARCGEAFAALGARLRAAPPTCVVTCARGSSDHAATYGKYLIETMIGRVVASVGPSVASVYGRPLALDGALFVAVSQSGRSADLVQLARAARAGGALVVALVNDEHSPLAGEAELVLPTCAGEEHAVAATKSYLLACVGWLQLAAAWADTPALHAAVARVPDALDEASALDWAPLLAPLAAARDLYVLGRGLGLGAAGELALKLKETCQLHAEAFSVAELRHGPVALVERGFPIIALGQEDETAATTRAGLVELAAAGAAIYATLDLPGVIRLPTVANVPAVIAPLCHVQTSYRALPALAAARGLDADAPRHLAKVTSTV